jgi:hypothetical protein
MKLAPQRALLVIFIAVVLGSTFAAALLRKGPDRRPVLAQERPKLLLLTSLPLVFNESFSLSGGGSTALKSLQGRYQVLPISVADGAELAKSDLLLMAQPPTQTAENLVVLDEWVRRGGRLLLLADPMLEWPSKLPFGNPLRPPPVFMDTGLLAHWGVRLAGPDRRGPAIRKLGGYDVLTESPGILSGACSISADRLVARCRIGAGSATIVSDADLLDVNRLGSGGQHNLDALLAELARVGRR